MSRHINTIPTKDQEEFGRRIALLLHLEPITGDVSLFNSPRFHTAWGTKTKLGIGACVLRLLSDIDEGKEYAE